MENVIHNSELSGVIYDVLKDRKIFRIALKPAISYAKFKTNSKWQIIENTKIETE